jgi:hypothetical protein
MREIIRKKNILPIHLDLERFEAIFARLEKDPGNPHSKRVERILDLLSGLRDDIPTRENMRNVTGLRNALGRYRWASRVTNTAQGYRVFYTIADRDTLSKDDEWEYGAVRDLLDTVPYTRGRSRIRRCEQEECRRWFFAAVREDQLYCSGKCRQRRYDSDPEKRDKKLAHMKKLYADEKARRLNPKSGVGLRRKAKKLRRAKAV